MTKQELIELIKPKLAAVGHGIVFEIVEGGVRPDQDWWYVPVLATRNGADVAREFTINVYANIEDDLEQAHQVHVLFVPVLSESSVG